MLFAWFMTLLTGGLLVCFAWLFCQLVWYKILFIESQVISTEFFYFHLYAALNSNYPTTFSFL